MRDFCDMLFFSYNLKRWFTKTEYNMNAYHSTQKKMCTIIDLKVDGIYH